MCAAAVLAVVVARMRAKLRTWFSSSCFHLDSYAEMCCLPYALYSSLVNWVDMGTPGVGEYQWREFLVASPDFFGVGAVVFLVFSVSNRVQGWFVVKSGDFGPLLPTLLQSSCH